ncbi:Membrane protein involved in the export of O-antigen and teichoic acid [Halorientalis persicus]|uniref:Membrane protein involved in the export of O-antigen and teichoic acid n=1 Tax=Halorientalis persicus TaxID=1367881 RepID=A0A1H8R1V8_9EURY|nr:oligosaccharide flippase family protein [Halorientalis persicus]SEO60402.1 Membrane protein involved in the export of O-antigen and teichoic acid [Halorientalis persicus]
MSDRSDFGEQVGFGFVGRLLTAALGLAGTVVVARMTIPEVYGLYFFIYGVADTLNNPFGGWVEGCRKRITESEAEEGEIMGAYVLGLALFTVFGVAVIAIAGEFGAQYIPVDGLGQHWPVLAALFVGLNLTQQTGMILSVRPNFGYHSWIDLLKTVLKYVGQIGLVVLGYEAGGLVLGTALALVVVAPLPFRLIGVRPQLPTRATVRRIWTFAKPKFPQSMLNTMMGRIDTILIGVLATSAFVGYYNVALRISAPAIFVTQLISNGAYGDISDLHSRGEAVAERLRHSASYSSVLSVPLFFGALILGREILVTAYEPKYAAAGTFLVLIALYRLLITQEQVFASAINGLDMPYTSFRISLVKFVTNVAGSVGLFFVMGPIGVVVGSTIAQFVTYALSVYAVKVKVPSLTIVPKPLLHQFVAGGVMAAVTWGIRQVVPVRSWVYVVALVGAGAAVYGAVLLAVSEHHRATLRNVLGGLLGKVVP